MAESQPRSSTELERCSEQFDQVEHLLLGIQPSLCLLILLPLLFLALRPGISDCLRLGWGQRQFHLSIVATLTRQLNLGDSRPLGRELQVRASITQREDDSPALFGIRVVSTT